MRRPDGVCFALSIFRVVLSFILLAAQPGWLDVKVVARGSEPNPKNGVERSRFFLPWDDFSACLPDPLATDLFSQFDAQLFRKERETREEKRVTGRFVEG